MPVWHCAITAYERNSIERVQKMALHLILGERYKRYERALEMVGLETRRTRLCINFALKAEKNEKFKHWFKLEPTVSTRQPSDKYWGPIVRTTRLKHSDLT